VRRIWIPFVWLCVLGFFANFTLFAQSEVSAIPKSHHYRWKLSFREKELQFDPQKTVYSSRIRIGRQFVAEFETRNNEWVEFDFVPDDFDRGAFWIQGYVDEKENGKYRMLFRGYNKRHISRWPRKQKVRIKLYSLEI
jgi:hypothetical protein